MVTKIIVPVLGESIADAQLLHWLKHVGDAVRRGDEIAVLETAKATMPLECPANGELLSIQVSEGETVVPGQLLAVVGNPGEKWEPDDADVVPMPAEDSKEQQPIAPQHELPESDGVVSKHKTGERHRVSPAARQLARDLGVNIDLVNPERSGLRITKEDVHAFVASSLTDSAPPSHRVALTTIQKIVAERMLESARQIPQFSISMDVDAGNLIAGRTQINNALSSGGVKVSITALLLHLLGKVLPEHPALNARYDGDAMVLYDTVNAAVAISTSEGLIAPVIRGIERLSLEETARRLSDLAARAREGGLDSREMLDGTFTVSNLGMYGVTEFVPLVNPPQTAILGVGAVRPVVLPATEGGTRHRQIIKLTVSADHRVTDGAGAAEFLDSLRMAIETFRSSN